MPNFESAPKCYLKSCVLSSFKTKRFFVDLCYPTMKPLAKIEREEVLLSDSNKYYRNIENATCGKISVLKQVFISTCLQKRRSFRNVQPFICFLQVAFVSHFMFTEFTIQPSVSLTNATVAEALKLILQQMYNEEGIRFNPRQNVNINVGDCLDKQAF